MPENNEVVYTSLAHRQRRAFEATPFSLAMVVLVMLAGRVRASAKPSENNARIGLLPRKPYKKGRVVRRARGRLFS
jgi:hypothetical protein